jgi:hypothetical protein
MFVVVGRCKLNPSAAVCVYLKRHWCLGSFITLRRAVVHRYAAAIVIERIVLCSLLLQYRVLFFPRSQRHLYSINAILEEAYQLVEAL